MKIKTYKVLKNENQNLQSTINLVYRLFPKPSII